VKIMKKQISIFIEKDLTKIIVVKKKKKMKHR